MQLERVVNIQRVVKEACRCLYENQAKVLKTTAGEKGSLHHHFARVVNGEGEWGSLTKPPT